MKQTLLLSVLLMGLFNGAEAKPFFSKVYHYLHASQSEVYEIADNDIDQEKNVASYFNYSTHKRETVPFSELSRETNEEIAGVKSGEFVLTTIKGDQLEPCQVYYLFENAMALIACKSNQMSHNIGVRRPILYQYILPSVQANNVVSEVQELNSFKKHSFALTNKKVGKIQENSRVRIEAIFANGEALVQEMGFSFLDTSSVLMKYNIEKVQLDDLDLN